MLFFFLLHPLAKLTIIIEMSTELHSRSNCVACGGSYVLNIITTELQLPILKCIRGVVGHTTYKCCRKSAKKIFKKSPKMTNILVDFSTVIT